MSEKLPTGSDKINGIVANLHQKDPRREKDQEKGGRNTTDPVKNIVAGFHRRQKASLKPKSSISPEKPKALPLNNNRDIPSSPFAKINSQPKKPEETSKPKDSPVSLIPPDLLKAISSIFKKALVDKLQSIETLFGAEKRKLITELRETFHEIEDHGGPKGAISSKIVKILDNLLNDPNKFEIGEIATKNTAKAVAANVAEFGEGAEATTTQYRELVSAALKSLRSGAIKPENVLSFLKDSLSELDLSSIPEQELETLEQKKDAALAVSIKAYKLREKQ